MTITVKGQITIPQALRERFALLPGTEVEFIAEADALRIVPRRRKKSTAADNWLAKAAGSGKPGITTDQILALSRGEH